MKNGACSLYGTKTMASPGDVIGGKYRLTRELGKGGMGAVYEATHVSTGRRVAVKVMKVSRDDDESTTVTWAPRSL